MKRKALFMAIMLIVAALFLASCGEEETIAGECSHQFGKWQTVREASCTQNGVQKRECALCGYVESESEEAYGHNVVTEPAVSATCTVDGSTAWKHCSVCNEVIEEAQVIPAPGHTEVVSPAKEATCSTTGLTEGSYCQVCNEVIVAQDVIPVLAHTEIIDSAISATCTTTGLTEGKRCSVCNTVIVAQQTTPALGHTEVVTKEAVAATCTQSGCTEERTCTVCGVVTEAAKTVAATGHQWTEATCTAPKTCSVCDKTEGSALGHTLVYGICTTCGRDANNQVAEIYLKNNSYYVTGVANVYTGTATKYQLEMSASSSAGLKLTVRQNDDGTVSLVTSSGGVLMADGTNVQIVYAESEYTKFVLETATNGVFIRCATATYEDNAQYLEVYKGYLTCWGMQESSVSAYIFQMVNVSNVSSGDSSTSGGTGSDDSSTSGGNTSDGIPVFSAGETWVVDGQWELSFEDALQTVVKSGKQTVQITWKYKNIGYDGNLKIGYSTFKVYDEEMEYANWTYYDVDYNNNWGVDCSNGVKATCVMGWSLNNSSTVVKIYVEIEDSNGVTEKAWFVLDIVEEQEEEDKLEGCTITVKTSLPQTISYYTSSGTKQSSCSVTDISFEVSGDDLYIYFTGTKTYDSRGSGQSDNCRIGWKLYDSNNNVIASGTAYTLSLATGEGFLKTKDTAYNCITAGETYYLVIMNVN